MSDLHQPATNPDQSVVQRLADLERQVQNLGITLGIGGSESKRLKVIRGTLNTVNSGVILAGEGFTWSRFSAGVALITWTVAFQSRPTLVCSADNGAGQGWWAGQQTTSTTGAQVQLQNQAGTQTDGILNFIAVGPA